MLNSTNKIFSAFIWTNFCTIYQGVYSFISVPILIKYFGNESYGLIALATSVNVYLGLLDMGLNSSNIKQFSNWYAKNDLYNLNIFFKNNVFIYGVIGLINGLVLIVVTFFSTNLFNINQNDSNQLNQLLYILAVVSVVSWVSSSFDQLIRSTENVAWTKKRSFIPISLQFILIYLTIKFKMSLLSYFAISMLINLCVIPFSIRKIYELLPNISFIPSFSKQHFFEILPYTLSILSFSIFQYSMLNLRPIILGIRGDVSAVVDYKIIAGIVSIPMLISGTFIGVLLPSVAKFVANNNFEAINRITFSGTKYIAILLGLLVFGGILIGENLIKLYVGIDYLHLYPWLVIWLLTIFLSNHNQAISSIILSKNILKPIAINSAYSTVIGLTLSWYLTPYFQLGGVVIGYLIFVLMHIGFYYTYYWPKYLNINSIKLLTESVLPPFIVGVISMLITLFVFSYISISGLYIDMIIRIAVFTIIYLLLSICYSDTKDRSLVLGLLGKFLLRK